MFIQLNNSCQQCLYQIAHTIPLLLITPQPSLSFTPLTSDYQLEKASLEKGRL